MSTRSVMVVMYKGEYRVADQKGADGYPEGEGLIALRFLRGMDRERFASNVMDCRFVDGKTDTGGVFGAKVLALIQERPVALNNAIDFTGSVFCEYVYVVDLDKDVFEVHVFDNDPPKAGRFRCQSLLRAYALNDLPSDETFMREMTTLEDELCEKRELWRDGWEEHAGGWRKGIWVIRQAPVSTAERPVWFWAFIKHVDEPERSGWAGGPCPSPVAALQDMKKHFGEVASRRFVSKDGHSAKVLRVHTDGSVALYHEYRPVRSDWLGGDEPPHEDVWLLEPHNSGLSPEMGRWLFEQLGKVR